MDCGLEIRKLGGLFRKFARPKGYGHFLAVGFKIDGREDGREERGRGWRPEQYWLRRHAIVGGAELAGVGRLAAIVHQNNIRLLQEREEGEGSSFPASAWPESSPARRPMEAPLTAPSEVVGTAVGSTETHKRKPKREREMRRAHRREEGRRRRLSETGRSATVTAPAAILLRVLPHVKGQNERGKEERECGSGADA